MDKIGVAYNDDVIATGYGSHIALPIMRSAIEEKGLMSEAEARKLMIRMLKVMYYRDKLSLNKVRWAGCVGLCLRRATRVVVVVVVGMGRDKGECSVRSCGRVVALRWPHEHCGLESRTRPRPCPRAHPMPRRC